MDIVVPQSKQVLSPEEATREALIAISNSDNAASETLISYKDGSGKGVNNRSGKEKYMYELISISNSQSPDSATNYPVVAAPVVDSVNHKISENYIDAEAPWRNVVSCSREATREALIAISYLVPDNGGVETLSYKDVGGRAVAARGGIERYMDELISISDSQSPDSVSYPVVVDSGNHKSY